MSTGIQQKNVPSEHVNILDNGGVAVVVGGRSTNFGEDYRNQACFQFWDSTDPYTEKRDLPSNAKAVVFTRFIGHHLTDRLYREARARGMMIYPVSNTGEVKRVLDRLIPRREKEPVMAQPIVTIAAPPVPAPIPSVPAPASRTIEDMAKRRKELGKGYLYTFVIRYGNLNYEVLTDEAHRLFKIAQEQNIPTTVGSLCQALRIQRRRKGLEEAKPKVLIPKVKEKAVESEASTVALKLLDDLAAGISLLREHIIKNDKRNATLEKRLKVLREALAQE